MFLRILCKCRAVRERGLFLRMSPPWPPTTRTIRVTTRLGMLASRLKSSWRACRRATSRASSQSYSRIARRSARERARIAGRKYARDTCLGFYHSKAKGEPAWIEIVIDNIVAGWFRARPTRVMFHLPVVRDLVFADTLFHDLGHHFEHTVGAPDRGSEASAETWNKRLLRSYFRKRYWYLAPFLGLAKNIGGAPGGFGPIRESCRLTGVVENGGPIPPTRTIIAFRHSN